MASRIAPFSSQHLEAACRVLADLDLDRYAALHAQTYGETVADPAYVGGVNGGGGGSREYAPGPDVGTMKA